jgi:hypothetical protein
MTLPEPPTFDEWRAGAGFRAPELYVPGPARRRGSTRGGTSDGPVYLRHDQAACGCDFVDLFGFRDGNQAALDEWAFTPESAANHTAHSASSHRPAMDWAFAVFTVQTAGGTVYGTFRWDRSGPAAGRWKTGAGAAFRTMTEAEEAVVAAASS